MDFFMKLNTEKASQNIQNLVFQKTGLKVFFNVSEKQTSHCTGPRVAVQSEDFASKTVPRMFKKVYFRDFGSMTDTKEGQRLHEIGISFRYEHFDMGANGCGFANIVLDDDGEIIHHEFLSELHS